jgi:hypothetical protein
MIPAQRHRGPRLGKGRARGANPAPHPTASSPSPKGDDRLRRIQRLLPRGDRGYRLWRDGGFAVGALAAGLLADAFGITTAIAAVAALTAASGLIVAARMYEIHPTPAR